MLTIYLLLYNYTGFKIFVNKRAETGRQSQGGNKTSKDAQFQLFFIR